jgi:hypothetical protein
MREPIASSWHAKKEILRLQFAKTLIKAGREQLLLQTHTNGASCFYITSLRGHLRIVKYLIEAGGRRFFIRH